MKLAIVGSGVSGLVAARRLSPDHEVQVFEAETWIGGHTHTVEVQVGGRDFAIDTGFIVYNERNYPLFARLLAELGVETQPSDMSFGVRCHRSGLEYATHSLAGLFARRRNAVSPAFLRMLRDVLRFMREGRAMLANPDEKQTLGELLDAGRYSREFAEHYLLPMGAAIWSAEPVAFREFPAAAFLRFFRNHGLLGVSGQPEWRVVRGGSERYVEALAAPFRDRVHTRTPVRRVVRHADGVELHVAGGDRVRVDRVIFATHSDQALRLLADPTDGEIGILSSIRYQPNDVVLHTDSSVLPVRRDAWASWNYAIPQARSDRVVVTYDMNRLQSIESGARFCVTLNDDGRIDPRQRLGRWTYEHPILDRKAVEAQAQREVISGVNRTHYCGAYWGYGFHEDGVRSGEDVVRELAGA